ncbi:3-hydroxy-3-methylglutaryl-coenzyme A reductase, putative [Phytophthora infestans T30-4]|uniref:3-hydroxy-3-methylglutaryl-coenzyme A reductase, putative n=1 Tax=Phytophthora infestans (strain T30-4) TaxID=403677 RepID=D0NUX2_PHYIT|nr:3-hydroxy-3-methylglutaryl-coenzyme A reductase, putative [Phytophthora infestans T30-4]EEY65495.1 3-hydroxy-3-methylglutaryl-coenzyme A reductase, putative [Phytophthora infestans T30-4]|eukprot:XP_002897124.1 3-hydroxy-3-methylglutaryl-coenzyme A reductase, putative [Phytophthora infestans T30-4]
MTNKISVGDALVVQATSRTDLETTLDQALALLRRALKTSQGVEQDDALQCKAAQVAALAAQVQRQCADTAFKQFNPLQPSQDANESWSSFTKQQDATPQPSVWSGFYNKTLRERFDVLALMYPRLKTLKAQQLLGGTDALGELPLRTANLMIENCVGVLGVPLGLGLNFVIDGKSLSVPMAVEEPSVVAAASSAAKLVAAAGGGFHTATSGNIMTSQIQLVGTEDIAAAIASIKCNRERLLSIANTTLCPNMKKRGGGAVDIYCRIVSQATRTAATAAAASSWYTPCDDELVVNASESQTQFLVVHIDVDVCEAMGANIVNTVAEGLSEEVSKITRSRVGLRILTNLCMQRRARAEFEIPLKKLGWKGVDGEDVANRIIEAYNFAAIDPYRAVTNNKGIMNGVDAVALATGQDWRAIESAAHCYASRSGQYASLSHYENGVARDGSGTRVLRGSLEMPIAVGSKGGALMTHPGYTATHAILQQPTARNLSGIIVSVGLAQNFAAIRAIAVTGIQKGHMALHARNIAIAAGAPSELVSEVCSYMLLRKSINMGTAKEYLHAHAVFSEIQSNSPPISPVSVTLPSMFYVEIPIPELEDTISLNIAFEAINKHPQYIAIMAPSKSDKTLTTLQRQLLGDKGYNQLEKMFMFLASMRSIVISASRSESDLLLSRSNVGLQNKLQLLSILINIIAYRLMEVRPDKVRTFMRQLLEASGGSANVVNDGDMHELDAKFFHDLMVENVDPDDDILSTGLPLFLALWQVLHYHIEQEVPHKLLRTRLVKEQWGLLNDIVRSYELGNYATTATAQTLDKIFLAYVAVQATRWQATLLLLIDSLALASELVTPERLDFLTRIGEYMEWEGSIAHDLARYQRDATERVPNAFLFWLSQRGISHTDGEQYEREFRGVANALAAEKWDQLLQEARRDSWAAATFSLPAVERVIGLIREIYGDNSGRSIRKESF